MKQWLSFLNLYQYFKTEPISKSIPFPVAPIKATLFLYSDQFGADIFL